MSQITICRSLNIKGHTRRSADPSVYYTHVGRSLRGTQSIADTPPEKLAAANSAREEAMAELTTSIGLDSKPIFSYVEAIDNTGSTAELSESRHWLDKAYFQIGMAREGLADLRAAADGGDGYAQSELGRHYMIGIPGVLTPDARTGLEWFKKSAAQGNPTGLQNLERARKLFGDSLGEKCTMWSQPPGRQAIPTACPVRSQLAKPPALPPGEWPVATQPRRNAPRDIGNRRPIRQPRECARAEQPPYLERPRKVNPNYEHAP